jgi:hypothetical protein
VCPITEVTRAKEKICFEMILADKAREIAERILIRRTRGWLGDNPGIAVWRLSGVNIRENSDAQDSSLPRSLSGED